MEIRQRPIAEVSEDITINLSGVKRIKSNDGE